MSNVPPKLITILGPTAGGKTGLAVKLANVIGGEIISADSRQVFKGMDIGTGKDLAEYIIDGKLVPYHLIDIAEPGTEFSLFRFLTEFDKAYISVTERGNTPVLCGGSGLYLDSVLRGYNVPKVNEDSSLRQELSLKSDDELMSMLASLKKLHNTTDTSDRERLIRAVEIELYKSEPGKFENKSEFINTPVFCLNYNRETQRERITFRLKNRLNSGLIEEVEHLLEKGIPARRLKTYGLEYKYVTLFLEKELDYDEMFRLLNTAIHQFAKRQMTWFRRMEKLGVNIIWLNGEDGNERNLDKILKIVNRLEREG
jgi:tRNA dimethylallyltransferase